MARRRGLIVSNPYLKTAPTGAVPIVHDQLEITNQEKKTMANVPDNVLTWAVAILAQVSAKLQASEAGAGLPYQLGPGTVLGNAPHATQATPFAQVWFDITFLGDDAKVTVITFDESLDKQQLVKQLVPGSRWILTIQPGPPNCYAELTGIAPAPLPTAS